MFGRENNPEEDAEKFEKMDVSHIEKILIVNEGFGMKTLRKICEIGQYEKRKGIFKAIVKLFQVCCKLCY